MTSGVVQLFYASALLVAVASGEAPKRELCDSESSPAQAVTTHNVSKKFESLIFEDTFDTGIDLKKWSHEHTLRGGGNWEFQYYTDDKRVSYVENNKLVIKPMFTRDFLNLTEVRFQNEAAIHIEKDKCTESADWGCSRKSGPEGLLNPIVSAKLIAKPAFKYGRVEVRAKFPKGDWLWPAIWMMPTNETYGAWPKSGEIDIIESRGNTPDHRSDGVDTVSSTLHWGNRNDNSQYARTLKKVKLPKDKDYSNDFHTYSFEWTEDYIRSYVDEQQLMDVDFTKHNSMYEFGQLESSGPNPWQGRGISAPFDQEFKLMINLAVGGVSFFPDNYQDGTKDTLKPWGNKSPQAPREFWQCKDDWWPTWVNGGEMLIDSVKIYQ